MGHGETDRRSAGWPSDARADPSVLAPRWTPPSAAPRCDRPPTLKGRRRGSDQAQRDNGLTALPGELERPPVARTPTQEAVRSWGILALRQALTGLVTLGGVFGLARLLAPADFAVYGFATTAMLIGAAVGDLGLGGALIKGDLDRSKLGEALGLQLAVWVPVGLVAAAAAVLSGLYGFSAGVVVLLFGAFFFVCLQSLPTAELERRVAFGAVAGLEVAQRVVFVGGALVLAALIPSTWSIAAAAAAAGAGGYVASVVLARWQWRPRLRRPRQLFSGFASEWWQGRLASQLNFAMYPLLGGLLFTRREVGLIVWALAVTQVPALLSSLAGRALFPTLGRIAVREQIAVYRRLSAALMLVALPIVAALFVCAQPLTDYVFGPKWHDGIPLLRLESATTIVGLAFTPGVPLFYLLLEPRIVKRVLGAWTLALWSATPLIALAASFLAPSIAQIAISAVALIAFDRLLRRAVDFSPLKDMAFGLCALVLAVGVGEVASSTLSTPAGAVALAVGVAGLQVAITLALSGPSGARLLLRDVRRLRPGAQRLGGGTDA